MHSTIIYFNDKYANNRESTAQRKHWNRIYSIPYIFTNTKLNWHINIMILIIFRLVCVLGERSRHFYLNKQTKTHTKWIMFWIVDYLFIFIRKHRHSFSISSIWTEAKLQWRIHNVYEFRLFIPVAVTLICLERYCWRIYIYTNCAHKNIIKPFR